MVRVITGATDLVTLYPEIAGQWHPALNGDIEPDYVAAHSNKNYFWICEKGHAYEASPVKRLRGDGCPYCSNRRVWKGFNDLETTHPELADDWDCEKNDGGPGEYTFGSTYRAHWTCRTCGYKWEARIRDRVRAKWKTCPECAKRKRGEQKHESALRLSGCITDPLLLNEWDYEKNKKGPEEYTPGSNENVFWVCSTCGYHFKAKISNRTNRKGGCACCSGKVAVPGVNDLATTHPQLAAEWHPTRNGDLKPSDITFGIGRKVWWLCPEGHEYKATPNHRSGGTNCPTCSAGRQTSFAEQAFYYYIKKVFPDAVNRYTGIFEKGMEVDIFIPSIKLAIEYDGEAWHKKDKHEREARKYQICQDHGIRLLRLKEKRSESDWGTADELLAIEDGPLYEHEYLGRTIRFLLDKIDPVCNMWTRKKPIFHSPVDIDIKRDEAEIRSYMTKVKGSFAELYPLIAAEWHPAKNGSLTPDKVKPFAKMRLWWVCPTCGDEYQAWIANRANGTGCPKCGVKRCGQSARRKVAMLDPETHEELRAFTSITEAANELGINPSNITTVCKGGRKKAGGYGWKYSDA